MAKKEILEEYRQRRDFEKTPEPEGQKEARSKRIFVVQEHHARRLHYDFRLAVGDTLKSWAVPRGLPSRTNDKRLAVQTEDHPLEYAEFEGHIPEGLYGAGEVRIWDRGAFHNLKDNISMEESLEKGQATFWLEGKKARGAFALIRTRMTGDGQKQWLLIKLDDKKVTGDLFAVKKSTIHSRDPKSDKTESKISKGAEGVRKAPQPEWIDPMLAVLSSEHFSSEDWIYERKFDGERCLVFRKGKSVRLVTRNRKIVNSGYPELEKAAKKLKQDDFIIDGEIVAFDDSQTSFSKLQNRMNVQHPSEKLIDSIPIFYYVFDILYFKDYDLMNAPLHYRKKILKENFDFSVPLHHTEYIKTRGAQYYNEACGRGWEGIIAKRIDSPYRQKRSDDWLKFKCVNAQEFVIGGWTDPAGSRIGLGALLLGYYDGGELVYAGKVGTGFSRHMLMALKDKLSAREQSKNPFSDKDLHVKGGHWAKPELVAQIGFAEWTNDGKLRQPRFKGLRRDKNAKEVVREKPKD